MTKEEAIKMLPEGDIVHTFRNGGNILMGADWDKDEIIKAMDKYGVELSGEVAIRFNHRLVLKDDSGYLFIETAPTDKNGD